MRMNDLSTPPSVLSRLRFEHAFVRHLPGDPFEGPQRRQVHGALYSRVQPTPVAAPRMVAVSPEVAALVGLDPAALRGADLVEVFAGNALLPGMAPYAANYGG